MGWGGGGVGGWELYVHTHTYIQRTRGVATQLQTYITAFIHLHLYVPTYLHTYILKRPTRSAVAVPSPAQPSAVAHTHTKKFHNRQIMS